MKVAVTAFVIKQIPEKTFEDVNDCMTLIKKCKFDLHDEVKKLKNRSEWNAQKKKYHETRNTVNKLLEDQIKAFDLDEIESIKEAYKTAREPLTLTIEQLKDVTVKYKESMLDESNAFTEKYKSEMDRLQIMVSEQMEEFRTFKLDMQAKGKPDLVGNLDLNSLKQAFSLKNSGDTKYLADLVIDNLYPWNYNAKKYISAVSCTFSTRHENR